MKQLVLLSAALGIAAAQAQDHQYPIGVEGLKAGTLPPPGVYLRDYNLFYFAGTLNDYQGHKVPVDFDVFAYAQAPRLIWISELKILGANYGADMLVPFIYTDFRAPFQASEFGLGDIFFEPITLSWHGKQFDAGVGYGFWAPTGESGAPADPGKGYWDQMFTLGGTWYPDTARTWNVSALARYEISSNTNPYDIRPGNMLSVEGGIGKNLAPTFMFGLAGYVQQQTTYSSGALASSQLTQVYGIGPEIEWVIPKWAFITSLRYIFELGSTGRPQGDTITLTLTKRF